MEMHVTKLIGLLVVVCIVVACSITVPVRGFIQNSSETFTGTTTGYLDRSGKLTVITSDGTTCNGDFVYVTPRTGEGVFHCNDGRSGPFQFASTGLHGTGNGKLADKTFIFTFGD